MAGSRASITSALGSPVRAFGQRHIGVGSDAAIFNVSRVFRVDRPAVARVLCDTGWKLGLFADFEQLVHGCQLSLFGRRATN